MLHTKNKWLPWQHLIKIVCGKIRQMTVKGVKLKSESFFSIFCGVLELWKKILKGGGGQTPPPVWMGLNTWHQHFHGWTKTSLFRNPEITVKFSSFYSSPADINTITQKVVMVSKLVQRKMIPYRSIIGLGTFQKIKYSGDIPRQLLCI